MFVWVVIALLVMPVGYSVARIALRDTPHWSTASHDSVGLAPDPVTTREPVIQVYAARTWGWRGAVAVHCWIVVKPQDADRFERYEVIGWRARRGLPAVVRSATAPDAMWFSNPPQLLLDRRGPQVGPLIERIEAVISSYPYADSYRTWPGPNSNTFVAHIGRAVPELGLTLPPTAIGKDFLVNGDVVGVPPSGVGVQFSLWGLAGFTLAPREGIEVNLLGLSVGIGLEPLGLKLPGVGHLGASPR
jgi:hypothetical protein